MSESKQQIRTESYSLQSIVLSKTDNGHGRVVYTKHCVYLVRHLDIVQHPANYSKPSANTRYEHENMSQRYPDINLARSMRRSEPIRCYGPVGPASTPRKQLTPSSALGVLRCGNGMRNRRLYDDNASNNEESEAEEKPNTAVAIRELPEDLLISEPPLLSRRQKIGAIISTLSALILYICMAYVSYNGFENAYRLYSVCRTRHDTIMAECDTTSTRYCPAAFTSRYWLNPFRLWPRSDKDMKLCIVLNDCAHLGDTLNVEYNAEFWCLAWRCVDVKQLIVPGMAAMIWFLLLIILRIVLQRQVVEPLQEKARIAWEETERSAYVNSLGIGEKRKWYSWGKVSKIGKAVRNFVL